MKLSDLINENIENVQLTDTQKRVLLSMEISATAELAYGVTVESDKAHESASILRKMGFIKVDESQGRAALTSRGKERLVSYNLIDDMGEPTEEGDQILASRD